MVSNSASIPERQGYSAGQHNTHMPFPTEGTMRICGEDFFSEGRIGREKSRVPIGAIPRSDQSVNGPNNTAGRACIIAPEEFS